MSARHTRCRRPLFPARRRAAGAWRLVRALAAGLMGLAFASAAGAQDILIRSLSFDRGWVSLAWDGGKPPYRVQVYTETVGRWLDLSDYLFENSFAGASLGDNAWFRVRIAEDTQAPTAPGGLRVAASRCRAAALSWLATQDDPAGAGLRSYRLYRNGTLLAELPAPETFFLDRNLEPETAYDYVVTAVDRVGNESPQSTPVSLTTPACVGASGPASDVRLAWDASDDPDVSGYVVFWGVRPGEYLWAQDILNETSVTIHDLQPCTAYFFAVRTYDDAGESGYSEEIAHITPDFSELLP